MPFPPAITLIPLHCKVVGDQGVIGKGTVTCRIPQALRDLTDKVIIGNVDIVGTLDASGQCTIQLPATDSAGVSPSGWVYTIIVNTDVYQETFLLSVPAATVGPLELAVVAHAETPPAVVVYTLAALLTAKGSIYVATAPGTPAALPVGADNLVLTADASTATGLKWAAGGGGAADATASSKGIVQLAGDLAGTAAAPTVPGLAAKAFVGRQILAGTGLTGGGDLAADRTLTVTYGATAGTAAQGNDARLQDATSSSKGIVQLGGDLAGTATAPTVPALANRVPTSRQVTSGTGLSGGGDLSADRTLAVTYGTGAGTATQGNDTRVANAVQTSRQVISGTGLTGGGDLTADRTLAVTYGATAGTAAQGNDTRVVGAVQSSLVTTKGDLLVATGSSTPARFAVGADGQYVIADSSQANGQRWTTAQRVGYSLADYGLISANDDPAHFTAVSTLGSAGWIVRVPVPAGAPINACWVALQGPAGVVAGGGENSFTIYDDTGALVSTTVTDDALWTVTGPRSKALPVAVAAQSADRFVWVEIRVTGYSTQPTFAFVTTSSAANLFDATGWPAGHHRSRPTGGSNHAASIVPATFGSSAGGYMPFLALS